jgi:hypothetical protein
MHGDFVDVGPQIPSAAIVTLDRVICCYPSFEPLLIEAPGTPSTRSPIRTRETSGSPLGD